MRPDAKERRSNLSNLLLGSGAGMAATIWWEVPALQALLGVILLAAGFFVGMSSRRMATHSRTRVFQ